MRNVLLIVLVASLGMVALAPAQAQTAICADKSSVTLHPLFDSHFIPGYPPIPRRLGEQGVTDLDVEVGQNGQVVSVRVKKSSGSERLDLAALNFVRAYEKWQPLQDCHGGAVTTVSFTWKLPNPVLPSGGAGSSALPPFSAAQSNTVPASSVPVSNPVLPPGCSENEEKLAELARAKGYSYGGSCNGPVLPPAMPGPTNLTSATNQLPRGIPGVGGEAIVLNLADWQSTGSRVFPGGFEQLWVLKGESAMNWSQMITISTTGKPGLWAPKQWVQTWLSGLSSQCGKLDIITQQDGAQMDVSREAAGHPVSYATSSALVHCTDAKPNADPHMTLKKHEVIWTKAIRGPLYGHLITREWHGDDLPPDSVLASDSTRQDWQNWFDQVRISSSSANSLVAIAQSAAAAGGSGQNLSGDKSGMSLPPIGGDEGRQVSIALGASPALVRHLREAAAARNIDKVQIRYSHSGPILGRFGAHVDGGTIYLTDEFVEEQANNHLYDVVTPDEIYPNSLVFVLGHLAHHIAQPPPAPMVDVNPPPHMDYTADAVKFLHARMRDEAQAYIQGWNDMIEAASRENGMPLSVRQVAQIIMNFRYRDPFVKAMRQSGDAKLQMQNSGAIEMSDRNIDSIAQALNTTNVSDFD